jgi:hypothetical protein
MTPSGIELATFQLVAQCLNQLRYHRVAVRRLYKYKALIKVSTNHCLSIHTNVSYAAYVHYIKSEERSQIVGHLKESVTNE